MSKCVCLCGIDLLIDRSRVPKTKIWISHWLWAAVWVLNSPQYNQKTSAKLKTKLNSPKTVFIHFNADFIFHVVFRSMQVMMHDFDRTLNLMTKLMTKLMGWTVEMQKNI